MRLVVHGLSTNHVVPVGLAASVVLVPEQSDSGGSVREGHSCLDVPVRDSIYIVSKRRHAPASTVGAFHYTFNAD